MSLWSYKVTNSQVPEMRTWTSLAKGHHSAYCRRQTRLLESVCVSVRVPCLLSHGCHDLPALAKLPQVPLPHLSFLFLVQILLRLQTTTHLHKLLHSLPCQAPVRSQISTGVVLISSPHQMCLFPHFYLARDGSTVHAWTLGGWESSCDYFWPKVCQ